VVFFYIYGVKAPFYIKILHGREVFREMVKSVPVIYNRSFPFAGNILQLWREQEFRTNNKHIIKNIIRFYGGDILLTTPYFLQVLVKECLCQEVFYLLAFVFVFIVAVDNGLNFAT